MKTTFSCATLAVAALTTSSAQAQPTYQYNDRYTSQRSFLPQAEEENMEHSPPPGQTLKEEPLSDKNIRNAKPMGKYIDAPSGDLSPLPRGGNQPPPEGHPYYGSPGTAVPQRNAMPQAMPGYSGDE